MGNSHTICLSRPTYGLELARVLAELLLNCVDAEGLREQVKREEDALKLGQSEDVEPVACKVRLYETCQLFSQKVNHWM